MNDFFYSHPPGLESPLGNLAEVSPSDTEDLPVASRALYVGTAGDLKIITVGGQTVTLIDAPAGWHPVRAARVLDTGTTASDIVAGW